MSNKTGIELVIEECLQPSRENDSFSPEERGQIVDLRFHNAITLHEGKYTTQIEMRSFWGAAQTRNDTYRLQAARDNARNKRNPPKET